MAATYFALRKNFLAFLKKIHDAVIEVNHINKLATKGAAACIQGYDARLGFGITRIKNQIVAKTEIKIDISLAGTFMVLKYL